MHSLTAHNSYKLPSLAHTLYAPNSREELREVFRSMDRRNVALLGRGTNVVLSQESFGPERPFVTTAYLNSLTAHEQNVLEVGAGTLMSAVGDLAARQSLSGFEELSTIPGSIGGAVYMNAGCYGTQIGPFIEQVEVLNRVPMQFEILTKEMISWKYRWCSLQKENVVITRVWVRLRQGIPALIRSRTDQTWDKRRKRFPLDEASAGSVFKRPQSGPPAGQLIEELGLKGYSIGGACVSTKHAGWIINAGNATPADIQSLIAFLRASVKVHHGVELEVEQQIV